MNTTYMAAAGLMALSLAASSDPPTAPAQRLTLTGARPR